MQQSPIVCDEDMIVRKFQLLSFESKSAVELDWRCPGSVESAEVEIQADYKFEATVSDPSCVIGAG
jgi:hypothetical protein